MSKLLLSIHADKYELQKQFKVSARKRIAAEEVKKTKEDAIGGKLVTFRYKKKGELKTKKMFRTNEGALLPFSAYVEAVRKANYNLSLSEILK